MSFDLGDVLVHAALVILGMAFLVLAVHALGRYRGLRRLVALLATMVVAWITAGVILEPATHPLWPIDILLWLIPADIVLLILRVTAPRGVARSR
jgi:cation transporter-like permease